MIHRLYAREDIRTAVRQRFGPTVIDADGRIDRAALGRVVFADPDGMTFLEALLHPRVASERDRWVREQRRRDPPPRLIVCEVPLLYEASVPTDFDVVAVVTAPDEVRRERVSARGQDFAARSARQMPEADKLARADETYVNDGTLDDLDRWVGGIVSRHGIATAR